VDTGRRDELLERVVELEGHVELFVRAIGRIVAGLPAEAAPEGTPALVVDSLEALGLVGAQNREMTELLDAVERELRGRAAARASQGRLVQTVAGGQLLGQDFGASDEVKKCGARFHCNGCGVLLQWLPGRTVIGGPHLPAEAVECLGPNTGNAHRCWP
jgi:hypothetical protein